MTPAQTMLAVAFAAIGFGIAIAALFIRRWH